jgi:hypothetical protein
MQFPLSEQLARFVEGIGAQMAAIPVNKEIHIETLLSALVI